MILFIMYYLLPYDIYIKRNLNKAFKIKEK